MNKILFYLGESSVCLLVFYLLYTLLLKSETGFQYNRFYLLVTSLLSFILPLVELPFFQQPEPLIIFVSEQLAPITINANQTAAASQNTWFTWKWILSVTYALGLCFFSYRLGRQLYRLYRFNQQTQSGCFYWHNIPVHKTHGKQPTFSFGNCIYWDNSQSLSAAETERILLHESVHVRQKHTLDILYLELWKSIFWFNPLLYLYQKALVTTHEFIADATVLRTTNQEVYTHLLAKQVLHRLAFSFGNYFNKSLTLKRMKMIKQTHRRPNKLKQLLVLPILGFLTFILSSGDLPVSNVIKHHNNFERSSSDLKATWQSIEEPVFPGGKEAMYKYLAENLRYPTVNNNLKSDSHTASITMAFIIDEKGYFNIKEDEINKTENNPFEAEINRVLKDMPKEWTPAKKDDKPISSRYLFSFQFYEEHPDEKKKIKQKPNEETSNTSSYNKLPTFAARTISVVSYAKTTPEKSVMEIDKIQNIPQNNQTEPIFTFVEQTPEFPGGLEKMYQFLGSNIKYPKSAREANLQGLVIAEFIVTKAGKIVAPKIMKSLSPDTDAEAKRVIGLMPTWNPGKQNGKPVNVKYTLPIKFSLDAPQQKEVKPAKTGYINWAQPLQDNC